MYGTGLNIINGIKDADFKDALMTHGLKDGSKAVEAINKLKANPAIYNTTEPRMTTYTAEINEYLYSDNSFITKSTNDAAFAASGEIRKLNDSNAGPVVTKGRFYPTSLAHGDNAPTKTVKVRKNTSFDWEIEYFHTDPDVVTRELTSEVPYDVRQDLLKAHADVLMQSIANFTAVEWSQGEVGSGVTVDITTGSNFFVFTSGTATRNSVVPNNTGTAVKVIDKQDMQNVKKALQRQQVVQGGTAGSNIYFLPTVEMYDDLLNIQDFINFEKTGRESKLIKGEVGVLYGMTILEPRQRDDWNANALYSYTALVGNDTTLTKVEDTATPAANMTSAGIAWVENYVLRAQGSAIVFPWMNSPIYMGDVYASEMRYGAKRKRGDNKGVVMLIENPFTT